MCPKALALQALSQSTMERALGGWILIKSLEQMYLWQVQYTWLHIDQVRQSQLRRAFL